jgi:hypothetical protein
MHHLELSFYLGVIAGAISIAAAVWGLSCRR